MSQLPDLEDPIDVDSWNSGTQSNQNSEPAGYHHAFGHYPLRPAPLMPNQPWSPHAATPQGQSGQFPPPFAAPFSIPPTTPPSFFLATLPAFSPPPAAQACIYSSA